MRNAVLVAAAMLSAVAACSSDAPSATNEKYCSTVSASLDALNAPSIADSIGVTQTANLYRSIASVAPLAVHKEWETLTSNVEAAAQVDPNDPAAVQHVSDMTRSSQQAALAISDYTSRLCGITIGSPTTTLPPVDTTPATAA